VPIVVLSARGAEADKVAALDLGADDYVTKPFGILEFLARVEALLRRATAPAALRRVDRFGDIAIDREARTVLRGGELVSLKPKEFDLLVALYDHEERAVSRVELVRDVWGYSDSVITRTIDTHVAELRRKLEKEPRTPAHILTVQRYGYRLVR
jgi:DNA-binding response OmpR family regulator